MGEFFIGFIFGTVVGIGAVLFAGGPLDEAQHRYTRCISDGGTQQHCVEKYLLPKKETP